MRDIENNYFRIKLNAFAQYSYALNLPFSLLIFIHNSEDLN